ncbi:MAG: tetratricopeptide repeat protein [Saprospiraceae bacterium]|nr:tetratricopeptide repeat protein [Saprospiraceae bacterium]
MGNLYYRQEQSDSAEIMYQKAIVLDPGNTFACLFLGLLYFENNRMKEAEQMFLDAIRTDELFTPAYECLVTSYQQDWDKAVALLRQAPLETIDKINVLYQSGMTFMRTDAYDDALRAFRLAVKLDPDEPLGYYALCSYYALKGQPDEAVSYLEKTLEKARTSGVDYYDQITADENLEVIRTQKVHSDHGTILSGSPGLIGNLFISTFILSKPKIVIMRNHIFLLFFSVFDFL